MNLLVIADDESVGFQVPNCNVDVLVSCGDLPDELILKVAKKCHCKEILAVKGNHDSSAAFPAPMRDLHLNVSSSRSEILAVCKDRDAKAELNRRGQVCEVLAGTGISCRVKWSSIRVSRHVLLLGRSLRTAISMYLSTPMLEKL